MIMTLFGDYVKAICEGVDDYIEKTYWIWLITLAIKLFFI